MTRSVGAGMARAWFLCSPKKEEAARTARLHQGPETLEGEPMRTIIAQTTDRSFSVTEIRDTVRQTPWYALQDRQQNTIAQYTTKRAAMRAWRARTTPPPLHAEVYSPRRRSPVHLCDGDTISPQTTADDAHVTCRRCARMIKEAV